MTPQNVKDFVETATGESFSDENFLLWLNDVNAEILSSREWGFQEYKQAYTTSTSSQALPTNWEQITKVASSDGMTEYERVDFNQQDFADNTMFSYWIDEANGTITFASAGASVNLYYTLKATDLTMSSTFPIPSQFHNAYKYGVIRDYFLLDDEDETTARQGEMYGNKFNEVMRKLTDYDAKHKCSSGEVARASDDYLISNGIIPR